MSDRPTSRPSAVIPPTQRSLPIALIRARERVMGPIRDMLAETGLTEQQWRVLRVLDESGPLDATTLADRACLLMPSLTRIGRALEEKTLIARQPDSQDRRRQLVEITEFGRAIIRDNIATANALAAGVADRLGAEKYGALLDLLEELSQIDEPHQR